MGRASTFWAILCSTLVVTLTGCASTPTPPKDGIDWDSFFLDRRTTKVVGQPLRPEERTCLKLVFPLEDPQANEVVLDALGRELSNLGRQIVQDDCQATVQVNLMDSTFDHKGHSYLFLVKKAIVDASNGKDTASIDAGDGKMVDKGRQQPRVFDMTPFTMVNQSLSLGKISVNAGASAMGVGLLLDATGAHGWLNEKMVGDPRGVCGGRFCRFWDHHATAMRFIAVIKRKGVPDASVITHVGLLTREPAVADLFTLTWSDFTRSLAGLAVAEANELLPGKRIGTYDYVPYTGSDALFTLAPRVLRGTEALATAK